MSVTSLHRSSAKPPSTSAFDFSTPPDQAFRQAMRGLASAVTIVTSCDEEGKPHGMAATAVIPVSMDPPSMLVAVNRTASLHPVLERTKHFCVNILPHARHDIVQAFSRSELRERRFTDHSWLATAEGVPYLAGAQSSILCRRERAFGYGTHTLYIGAVTGVLSCELAAPLVWFDGKPLGPTE